MKAVVTNAGLKKSTKFNLGAAIIRSLRSLENLRCLGSGDKVFGITTAATLRTLRTLRTLNSLMCGGHDIGVAPQTATLFRHCLFDGVEKSSVTPFDNVNDLIGSGFRLRDHAETLGFFFGFCKKFVH